MTLPVTAEQIARNGGTHHDVPIHEVQVTFDAAQIAGVITTEPARFILTPDAARNLAIQLDLAAENPTTCTYCGRYVEKPSNLTDLCGTCRTREDQK